MATRLAKHLRWDRPQEDGATPSLSVARAEPVSAPSPPVKRDYPTIEPPMSPHDEVVYLLNTAAEVEHALMVQYLFAAFSLGGKQVRDARRGMVEKWRQSILEIAKEEMGHLMGVENVLRLVGGAPTFERDDYPIPPGIYPFEFCFERLTKDSLAKYVIAEMPNEVDPAEVPEIDEIKKRARVGNEDVAVNRVGMLYEMLQHRFDVGGGNHPGVTAVAGDDVDSGTLGFQASPDEWGLGYDNLLVKRVASRADALALLRDISIQGEGTESPDPNAAPEASHFGRFLEIYREFPDEDEWAPARLVVTNPVTLPGSREQRREQFVLENEEARWWAHLFNRRYRMLLVALTHAFVTEAPEGTDDRTPRGLLISWTFGEMYNLRSVADILMRLPAADPADGRLAGPPFEMPYSLALPLRERERWRLHRDLLDGSTKIATHIQRTWPPRDPRAERFLIGLLQADEEARHVVTSLVRA